MKLQRDLLNAFPGMNGRTYWLQYADGHGHHLNGSENSSASEIEEEGGSTEKSGGK